MTRYLIFLASLTAVECGLIWSMETAIRILIREKEHADIYRWAVRILTIQIAHYATCAYIFWDIRPASPMLIPVLSVTVMLAYVFWDDRRRKKAEFKKGYPRIKDMLVSVSRHRNGDMILSLRSMDELVRPFFFREYEDDKEVLIGRETDVGDSGDLFIWEWGNGEKKEKIGRLVPELGEKGYDLHYVGDDATGGLKVRLSEDDGSVKIFSGHKLLILASPQGENQDRYDVYYQVKGDRIWENLLRSV